jgi:glycosyltransferase involved in cell wall biosynthesis
MRILYFSLDYTTHDRRFLAKMVEPKHEVFFLRLRAKGTSFEARELPTGVRSVDYPAIEGAIDPPQCRAQMPALQRVLEQVKPDLVHAGPIPTCAFMIALSGFRPLLAMSWGSDILVEARDDEIRRSASKYTLARSDFFIVDCDAVRERIRAMTGAGGDRFVQLPWGLELAHFPRIAPRPPRDEIVVLSTRSWAPIYGIETVVAAFALAYRAEPRLRLTLLGDGPLGAAVERAIALHGLERIVTRPGRVGEDSLGAYFAAADVYLSCALSDGTSVSLLEAMAYGLPAVVTDIPSNREWVTENEGGWLAPAGDAPGFAQGLLAAAHLTEYRRNAIALRNRDVIERRADWVSNSERLLSAYERAFALRQIGSSRGQ